MSAPGGLARSFWGDASANYMPAASLRKQSLPSNMVRHRTLRRAMASASAKMPHGGRRSSGSLGGSVGTCPDFLTTNAINLKGDPHSTVLREFGTVRFSAGHRLSIRHIVLLQNLWPGAGHGNEENATVIGNLHGGMAERRAGSGGTSAGTKALFRSRDDTPLAAAVNSARRRWRRAMRFPI